MKLMKKMKIMSTPYLIIGLKPDTFFAISDRL